MICVPDRREHIRGKNSGHIPLIIANTASRHVGHGMNPPLPNLRFSLIIPPGKPSPPTGRRTVRRSSRSGITPARFQDVDQTGTPNNSLMVLHYCSNKSSILPLIRELIRPSCSPCNRTRLRHVRRACRMAAMKRV